MAEVLIQGILCKYRDLRPRETILYENLPQDEQIFDRVEPPFDEREVEAMADKELSWSELQTKWKKSEEEKFDNGVYAYINGILRFIPGSYWCYCNHWTLENGEKPDYREDEREFAVFLEHCCFNSPLYGATRPKGRRQGATSFGSFFQWFIAGRKEYKNCGTVSFNDDAAADVFQNMIMPGFKSLLPCFQNDFDSPDDGKSFLRFVKPVDKRKKGLAAVKRQGLNSLIDYKATTINSYTNKRVSFILLDEFGRWAKLNCNIYWSKLSKALRKGRRKVGFAYLPTVVNPRNEGGEEYKRFYEQSNQRKYGIDTPTGVVIFIMYGTQCYQGCIDKFGNSIIEDPVEPIMGNDGEMIYEGSKTCILRERAKLSGDELMEHRRDWPIDEYDIFAFDTGACEFNEENIQAQIKAEESNPSFWRRQRLVIKKEIVKSNYPGVKDVVKFTAGNMDDAKGGWLILEPPNKENHFSDIGGRLTPLNKMLYQIGVDTTQDRIAVDGSNPAIVVFKKSCIVDGKETGMYPVAIWDNPTRMDIHFDEEVKKACMWYGCTVNYELDRRTDFYRYFCKEDCHAFLEWTPRILMNPLKPNKKQEYGSRSGDPFQLAQMLQISKWYIDGDSMDVYNGHVHRVKYIPLLYQALRYDHLDRGKSDLFVALQMALVSVFGDMQKPIIPTSRPRQILPTYKIIPYVY